MYRVLIADDDILMREALNIMIAKDRCVQGGSYDGNRRGGGAGL